MNAKTDLMLMLFALLILFLVTGCDAQMTLPTYCTEQVFWAYDPLDLSIINGYVYNSAVENWVLTYPRMDAKSVQEMCSR